LRRLPLLVLTCAVLSLAACGDSGSDKKAPAATPEGQDLGAIKTYLLDHTKRLQADVVRLRANAEAYHALASSVDFDTKRLLAEHRAEASRLMKDAKAIYIDSNPAYEEMEGVVAGVPELADYDVIIDAGGDASDPATAVPFSIKTEDGRTFKQPGNLFFLVESSLYGTEPKFVARRQGRPRRRRQGRLRRGAPGRALLPRRADGLRASAPELDAAAKKWTPTRRTR
jgi:hypothetical protein